jgi:hypothetical protein
MSRRAARPGLVREYDRARLSDETGELGIEHDVLQPAAVCRGHELNAPAGHRAHDAGIGLEADLINDQDLRAVIDNRLQHEVRLTVSRFRRPRGIE